MPRRRRAQTATARRGCNGRAPSRTRRRATSSACARPRRTRGTKTASMTRPASATPPRGCSGCSTGCGAPRPRRDRAEIAPRTRRDRTEIAPRARRHRADIAPRLRRDHAEIEPRSRRDCAEIVPRSTHLSFGDSYGVPGRFRRRKEKTNFKISKGPILPAKRKPIPPPVFIPVGRRVANTKWIRPPARPPRPQ